MPDPKKYKRASSKFLSPEVLEATARMTMDLTVNLGIDAAVAGGYAMQVYGSPRLTGDVDLIASEAPKELKPLKSVRSLSFGGMRYKSLEGVEIDLIERADDLKGLYEQALAKAIETDDGLRVISPDYLAVIKFAAGRPKDEDDLIWILQQPDLVDRENAINIAYRYLGGRYAKDSFQSFIDEADWRSERERKSP